MADRIGQQLGQYRLTRLIGKGGFAEVYLGEHVRMLTQFAVKVLHAQLEREEENRFQEEARIVASLSHPNLIHLHDYAVHDGTPYLVMDLASNGTLRTLFPKGTPQPPGEILPYVMQVAQALHFAHSQQVIHRDVKPENMLLNEENQVLLSDFGIAVVLQNPSYKAAQEVLGTAVYMAPEQMQGRASPASDQYSLAVLIYEWLCGAPPFQGTMPEVMAKHLFAEPQPLRDRVRTISPAVARVVMGALSKDPEDRFSSVASFASAFEDACQAAPMLMYAAPSLVETAELPEPNVVEPGPDAPTATETMSPAMQALQALTEMTSRPPAPPVRPAPASLEPAEPPAPPVRPEPAPPPLVMPIHSIVVPRRPGAPKITDPFPREPEPPEPMEPAPAWPATQAAPERFPRQPAASASAAFSLDLPEPPASAFSAPRTSGPLSSSAFPATPPIAPIVLSAPPTSGSLSNSAFSSAPPVSVSAAPAAPPKPVAMPAAPPVFPPAAPPGPENAAGHGRGGLGPTWREVNWMPAPQAPNPTAPRTPTPEPPRQGISRRTVLIGGLVGLTAVGGALTWLGISKLTTHHPQATGSPSSTKTSSPTATPVKPGATAYTYTGHSAYLRCVGWSPDGKRIASASDDHTVQVWDALTGAHAVTYKGHTAEVLAVAWSPDGTMLASGSRDDTLRIWSAATQEKVHTFNFDGRVIAVEWSHDGKYLVAGSWDGSIQVWNTSTWKQIQKIPTMAETNMISWSPDNVHFAAANDSSEVVIWNATSGNKTYTYGGHNTTVLSVAWSPDGKQIVSGDKSPGKTLQCWDSTSGKPIWNVTVAGQTPALAWSPDGKHLAAGGTDTALLNPQNGSPLSTHQGDTWTLAWSPDGKYIASGGQSGAVAVWQAT